MTDDERKHPSDPFKVLWSRLWNRADSLISGLQLVVVCMLSYAVILAIGTNEDHRSVFWTAVSAVATTVGVLVALFGLRRLRESVAAQAEQTRVGNQQLLHEQRRAEPVFLSAAVNIDLHPLGGYFPSGKPPRIRLKKVQLWDKLTVTLTNDGGIAYRLKLYIENFNIGGPSYYDHVRHHGGRHQDDLQPGETFEGSMYSLWSPEDRQNAIGKKLHSNQVVRHTIATFVRGQRDSLYVMIDTERLQPRIVFEYIDYELQLKRQHFVLDYGQRFGPICYPYRARLKLIKTEAVDEKHVADRFRFPQRSELKGPRFDQSS